MPTLRRLGLALYRPFRGNKAFYQLGKAIYQIFDSSGGFTKENERTLQGPALFIRANADFSDEGFINIKKMIKKYGIRPAIALKMGDLDRNPAYVGYAKELHKLGCGLAVHGYGHGTRLPTLGSNEKRKEILLAITAFERHFHERPAAFFASRNAYDAESLRIMRGEGIEFYAEENRLYPEKREGMWDLCLNTRLFDPKGGEWKEVADNIISRNGFIHACWHIESMSDAAMPSYYEFLDYMKKRKVRFVTLNQLGRELP